MFNRLFGRDKQAKPREQPARRGSGGGGGPSQSLEKLDSAIELLEKREGVLEKKAEVELGRAKEFLTKKNKTAALQCMKRKKAYDEQLLSIGAQKQNLETLKFTIQSQNMNNAVLEAQLQAKNELKDGNKKMNADKVEENMEDLLEEMDKANSVAEALRQPLDDNGVDEDELMAELMLELDTAPEEKAPAVALPDMPKVPSSKLPAKAKTAVAEDDDEEALRALEAELQS